MPTLIDTSVLARLLERDSAKGRAAERTLSKPDGDWAVCSQMLTEFWVVATRPAENNGYGLDPGEVDASIEDLLAAFFFRPIHLNSLKSGENSSSRTRFEENRRTMRG